MSDLVKLFSKIKEMTNLMTLDWMKIKFSGDAQALLQRKSRIRIFGNVMPLKWWKRTELVADNVIKILRKSGLKVMTMPDVLIVLNKVK